MKTKSRSEQLIGALPKQMRRLHRDERGQVSLLVAIIVLGLGIACCFVANISERVNEKIEVQNAADAAAYSNALWAARGMNAITATNHLMGELTALCVIHESLCASSVERGDSHVSSPAPFATTPSQQLSREIVKHRRAIHPNLNTTIAGRIVNRLEEPVVPRLADFLARDSAGEGRHFGGAAVFDSMIQVKLLAEYTLAWKEILRKLSTLVQTAAAIKIPPIAIAMEILDGVIGGVQLAADKLLLDLVKEKAVLVLMDRTLPALGQFKGPVRLLMIPALSQYATSVVYSSEATAISGVNLVGASQAKSMDQFTEFYIQDQLLQSPSPETFHLPVELDTTRSLNQRVVIPFSNWTGEDMSEKASLRPILRQFQNVIRALGPIKEGVKWAKRLLNPATTWATKAVGEISPELKRLAEGWKKVSGIAEFFDSLDLPSTPPMNAAELVPNGNYENPTWASFEEKKNQIDFESEKHSQWVRSTFPYVDSYRAPLRGFFDRVLPNSCMRTFFAHWTNRFTMIECYLRRREDTLGTFIEKRETEDNSFADFLDPTGPPEMYVMSKMDPTAKGKEPWTTDKRLAEKYFTLIVCSKRNSRDGLVGPGLFNNPNQLGTVCFAQAIFYNANGRLLDENSTGILQANTGWDTLNWAPPVVAPEWQNGTPSDSTGSFKFPVDVFTGRSPEKISKAKLNWQAKLVPLTKSRLRDFYSEVKDSEIRQSTKFMFQQPDALISH